MWVYILVLVAMYVGWKGWTSYKVSIMEWWYGKKICLGDWLWDPTCTFVEERYLDPKIPSPIHAIPRLTEFSDSNGAGAPIFRRLWYRIRIVNPKNGAYSAYGPWTLLPVESGGCNLPCIGADCNSSGVQVGKQTCTFNTPIIGIPSSHIPKDHVVNLHRYVDKSTTEDPVQPPNSTVSECVGTMLLQKTYSDGLYYTLTDVVKNPCNGGGCQKTKVCNGMSVCPKK